ncbi:MAG TPA: hypothetical protein VI256_10925 [Roseiarcus sp.]|jgi:hypothetical protein
MLAVTLPTPSGAQEENVGQLGAEENGWRVATHGFRHRQAYARDFAFVQRAN